MNYSISRQLYFSLCQLCTELWQYDLLSRPECYGYRQSGTEYFRSLSVQNIRSGRYIIFCSLNQLVGRFAGSQLGNQKGEIHRTLKLINTKRKIIFTWFIVNFKPHRNFSTMLRAKFFSFFILFLLLNFIKSTHFFKTYIKIILCNDWFYLFSPWTF